MFLFTKDKSKNWHDRQKKHEAVDQMTECAAEFENDRRKPIEWDQQDRVDRFRPMSIFAYNDQHDECRTRYW